MWSGLPGKKHAKKKSPVLKGMMTLRAHEEKTYKERRDLR
jgi:hypothetical protein